MKFRKEKDAAKSSAASLRKTVFRELHVEKSSLLFELGRNFGANIF